MSDEHPTIVAAEAMTKMYAERRAELIKQAAPSFWRRFWRRLIGRKA